jgi:ketosteroid isomerase-like protein
MSTNEVAQQFAALIKEHREEEAQRALYAPDIVSVEATAMPNMPAEARGLDAVKEKGKWWRDNNTVHSARAEGPFPHGDRFAMVYEFDVTSKPTGDRRQMKEVAVYTVRAGKITREEFFYST